MAKEIIYEQIKSLKARKGDTDLLTELIKTTGYVNIIDILLLPLYFTWEQKYGNLNEVCFEKYLENPYQRFCLSTRMYTRLILSLLKRKVKQNSLSQENRNMIESLIKIYSN